MTRFFPLWFAVLASCAQSKPPMNEPLEPSPPIELTTQTAPESAVEDAGLPEIVAPPPAYGNKIVLRRPPKPAPKAPPRPRKQR